MYGTNLVYEAMTVKEYTQDRIAALGEFMGMIVVGIYKGMLEGAFDLPSDFEKICGRPHKTTLEIIREFKEGR